MSFIKHPFANYPFNEKQLDADIKTLIKELDFYNTSRKIGKVIADKNITDANNLLCWAYFEWMDAMATEADEDIVSCGEAALAIISDILAQTPDHKPSLKLKNYIDKQIARVHKVNKQYEKFKKIPIDQLTLEQVKDYAYFLGDFKTDKDSKQIEYQLWERLYNEQPDQYTYYHPEAKRDMEVYGNRYFNLNRMAHVLWEGLGQYEAARPLLWQLINWSDIKDVSQYSFGIDGAIKSLAFEAIEKEDANEFIRLINTLESKYQEISNYKKDNKYPIIPSSELIELIRFGLKSNHKATLVYLLLILTNNKYFTTKDTDAIALIDKAKAMVNQ